MANNILSSIYRVTWPVIVTDPAAPASGAPLRFGSLTGIALADEGGGGLGATETMVDFGIYVADHPVTDHVGGGVAVGAAVFYVDAVDALENDPTGYFYGFALEAVGVGATTTVNVLHVPSPGAGTVGAGTVGTAALAAGAISADAAGRALMANDYFTEAHLLATVLTNGVTNAVLIDAILNGAFQADAPTRALFGAGIWTATELAAESVTGAKVAEAAAASVIGAVPLLYHKTIADVGAPTNYDITVTSKIRVTDFWILNTGLAAHNTDDKIQLANGANAISNEVAKTNVVNAVKRATTLDPATVDIADGGTLRIIATKSTNIACEAFVLAYRVA